MTKKGRNRLKSLPSIDVEPKKYEPKQKFTKGELLPDDYPVYGDYIYMADDKPVRSDIFGDVSKLKDDLISQGINFKNIYSARWEWA